LKAFLEHFAAIVGAFTLALLTMSVAHEYGYFWSIGQEYQTFLTTSDYLTNGILWIPLALVFIYQAVEWKKLKEEPPSKTDWKDWRNWAWRALAIGVFGYAALAMSWPLSFVDAFDLVVICVFVWAAIWRHFSPNVELDEPFQLIARQMLRLGPPVIVAMFAYGSVNANSDLTRFGQAYAFRFKNEDAVQLRIFLRDFDKGLLLRNVADKKIEFRR